MNDDFYVVLPSNVKNVSGERNTISSYRTYLPKPITLDKNVWHVALVQIDLPVTWTNVSGDIAKLHLKQKDSKTIDHITSRYYAEGLGVIRAINGVLSERRMKTRLKEMPRNFCNIHVARHEKIGMHPTLSSILGFVENAFSNYDDDDLNFVDYNSRYPMDTKAALYNLYVYTDLISESIVGDSYVPLLQTIPIPHHRSGNLIHKEFLLPQYMKLQTGIVSSIHIQLCDETGHLVQFEKGHVILKLHFKQYHDGTR